MRIVGDAGAGTRLKLVVNHWLLALVDGLAETIDLAEAIDVDPRTFLETISGGPLGPAYADVKGSAMIERTAMSRDINDTVVVYEVAGYLRQSGSPRAADALLGLMMSMASMIESAKLERQLLAGARVFP